MSEHPVPTINKTDLTADWFESLERCFRWSERSEQKPLEDGDDGDYSGSDGGGAGATPLGGGALTGSSVYAGGGHGASSGSESDSGGRDGPGGGGGSGGGGGGKSGAKSGGGLLGEVAFVAGRPANVLPPAPNGMSST
jgi:hypothetical protein